MIHHPILNQPYTLQRHPHMSHNHVHVQVARFLIFFRIWNWFPLYCMTYRDYSLTSESLTGARWAAKNNKNNKNIAIGTDTMRPTLGRSIHITYKPEVRGYLPSLKFVNVPCHFNPCHTDRGQRVHGAVQPEITRGHIQAPVDEPKEPLRRLGSLIELLRRLPSDDDKPESFRRPGRVPCHNMARKGVWIRHTGV